MTSLAESVSPADTPGAIALHRSEIAGTIQTFPNRTRFIEPTICKEHAKMQAGVFLGGRILTELPERRSGQKDRTASRPRLAAATNAEGRSNRFHAACAVGRAASRGRLA